ncbi:MAG: radical SAM protein [Bacteroidales bacterium]|nr:radical SAM protein [Bacteroidales bacterium]
MHCNIPVFIPQLACPHACIYCNQRYISGQITAPSLQEVKTTIDTYLSTLSEDDEVELAFFGGSFTGLSIEEQNNYFSVVKPYINSGRIKSIRLSTRPDYIDEQILDNLKANRVEDIELGAQSLCDEVLLYSQRGHTCGDVERASQLINSYDFNLGLQMMIGLPLDTKERSVATAKKIVSLGAKTTRIYPTLVIDRTVLAKLYREGKYQPLDTEQAIDWTKDVYKVFAEAGVKVLRVGLHPSKDILSGKGFLAGPFHVSFFELVLSSIWKDKLSSLPKDVSEIYVNPSDINYAVGYGSSNKKMLQAINPKIKFLQSSQVPKGDFLLR